MGQSKEPIRLWKCSPKVVPLLAHLSYPYCNRAKWPYRIIKSGPVLFCF